MFYAWYFKNCTKHDIKILEWKIIGLWLITFCIVVVWTVRNGTVILSARVKRSAIMFYTMSFISTLKCSHSESHCKCLKRFSHSYLRTTYTKKESLLITPPPNVLLTRNSFDQTPNEQHTQHFDIIFQPFEYLLNSSQRKNFKDFLNKLGEDDRKVDRKIFSVFAGKRLANKWQQMAPEVPFSPLAWEVLKALI